MPVLFATGRASIEAGTGKPVRCCSKRAVDPSISIASKRVGAAVDLIDIIGQDLVWPRVRCWASRFFARPTCGNAPQQRPICSLLFRSGTLRRMRDAVEQVN